MTSEPAKPIKSSVVLNLGIIVIGLAGLVILLLVQLLGDEPAAAEPIDIGEVHVQVVASGLEWPVLLTGDGQGGRYVVEQRGTVQRLDEDGSIGPQPFLDLRDRVLHHHERGLLGLAFHPEHAANGQLYALYSREADDGATVLSEFTVGDGDGDDGAAAGSERLEATEQPLLVIPPLSTMHKGGMIAFDTEGMLLAGIGDGTTGNDQADVGLDPSSLLGALLRLDVDRGFPYGTPPDNGFAAVPGARAEVHAIGLRNPWRFSVDRATGDVYIGDVGQMSWEEINVLAPGTRAASFGWSDLEGAGCFQDRDCDPEAHLAPAVAYPHVDGETGHCSVIGGHVYRGRAGTLEAGSYLFADYCSGTLWSAPASELSAGAAEPVRIGAVPLEYGQVTSFGEDDAGELYLLTSGGYVLQVV